MPRSHFYYLYKPPSMKKIFNRRIISPRVKHRAQKNQGPLVTDWIQSLSVLIGLAIWIWQYAIYDHEQSEKKKEAVYQLIIAGQSESIMESAKDISNRISARNVELDDWALRSDLIPIHANLDAWAFCYSHDLCERKLVLSYTCKDVINFSNVAREMKAASHGIFFQKLSDPLQELISDCRAYTIERNIAK